MAVGNQKTQKMNMYVKIYKENYQFLKTSVYNDTHSFLCSYRNGHCARQFHYEFVFICFINKSEVV
jgi:hypothetical protein